MKRAWYQSLYEHFDGYDEEPYTQSTADEVDFLESVFHERPLRTVLDIGCGTGRHALELARRGYRVTGIDLSEAMIAQGTTQAEQEGLAIHLEQGDARQLRFKKEFEAAIMLCEGGFSLVETDVMDRAILQGAFSAIKPGGVFIMTSPNAEFMLARLSENEGFDPSTRRETFELEAIDEHGAKQLLNCTQRYYSVDELSELLASVGFAGMESFRVSQGYERGVSPTKDDFEFGMIASVPAHSRGESL